MLHPTLPPILHRAIQLAVRAHAGQDDPPGEPYIIHPMRVMLSLRPQEFGGLDSGEDADDFDAVRCVAILHDAVERGRLTRKQLAAQKFPRRVVRAIALLTHDKKDSYAAYVLKLKRNRLARAVKLADLLDNANLHYVEFRAGKPKKDSRRVVRYALSYKFLTERMSARDYRRLMRRAESD